MLPYDQTAKVLHQGKEIGEVAVSARALSEPRAGGDGAEYDWSGEADIEGAGLLVRKPNRRLRLEDGTELMVTAAFRHDYLPHVELRLREVRSG